MHKLGTFLIWTAICIGLIFIERWVPKSEHAFQVVIALTWLLWIFVGFAYVLRGIWRFMRS